MLGFCFYARVCGQARVFSVRITNTFPVPISMGLDGALDAYAVEQTGKNTFFGRTATLLQSVENLGNLQRILMRVVIVLLVSIAPLAIIISSIAPLCCSRCVHMSSAVHTVRVLRSSLVMVLSEAASSVAF